MYTVKVFMRDEEVMIFDGVSDYNVNEGFVIFLQGEDDGIYINVDRVVKFVVTKEEE